MGLNGSWEVFARADDGEAFGIVGLLDDKFNGTDELIGWKGEYEVSGTQLSINGLYIVEEEIRSIFGDLKPQTVYRITGSGQINADQTQISGVVRLPDLSHSPDVALILKRIPSASQTLRNITSKEGAGN